MERCCRSRENKCTENGLGFFFCCPFNFHYIIMVLTRALRVFIFLLMFYLKSNACVRPLSHLLETHYNLIAYTVKGFHFRSTKYVHDDRKCAGHVSIRPVLSEHSMCTQWVAKDSSFFQADSEDS